MWCALNGIAPGKDSGGLTQVADGVYARIVSPDGDAVSNSGIVVLDRSVIVFDTHFTPEAGEALVAAIRATTPIPVRYVVNSHWHADHTHGNQAFGNAQLISSVNARRDMLQVDLPSLNRTTQTAQTQINKLRQAMKSETDAGRLQTIRDQIKSREDYLTTMARLKITAPTVSLEDTLTIRENALEARILFLGAGHTDGDVVLYLPSKKIVFAGDLFFNGAIPNVQDASVLEWLKTLDKLLKLDAEKYLPGHGAVASKKEVELFKGYLEDLRLMVQAAVDRGDSLEQATREIQLPAKYDSYQFRNLFPANVQKMYSELKELQSAASSASEPAKREPMRPVK
jgi:glyoxylase-like metal-dependent hydrolase (beta-lactamase superfamily II)